SDQKKIITPLQLPPLSDDIPVLIFSDWISFGPKTRSFLSFPTLYLVNHRSLSPGLCIPEDRLSYLLVHCAGAFQSNLKIWGFSPPFLVCL
ncbi:hypothetical protein N7471_000730, partial [Penicillium samsonianum]|uniref:uncharacterized protein n=1 Tax=Penicillium samsonianum TaxID=1882272 RepID=UPI0025477918